MSTRGIRNEVENSKAHNGLLKEIMDSIQQEGIELTKFLDMVASFADDIAEEHKRYRAAIKAMKQASGIDQYDVMKAADTSLEGKRADFKQLVSRAAEIDRKLKELNKQVQELERERSIISDRRAAKEKEIGAVEESYKSVAEHLSKQIGQVKDKLSKYLSEDFKGEPVVEALVAGEPLAAQVDVFTPGPTEGGQGDMAREKDQGPVDSPLDTPGLQVSSPMDNDAASEKGEGTQTRKQKECSSCSGLMDWYAMEKVWKCYACGHEEKVRKKKK
jgi:hypothetical protein